MGGFWTLETLDWNYLCEAELFVQNGTFHFQIEKYSSVTYSAVHSVRFVVMVKKKRS